MDLSTDAGVAAGRARHDSTPVARGVADGEKHRNSLPPPRVRERVRPPLPPVDGVLGVLKEVWRGRIGKSVGHSPSLARTRQVTRCELTQGNSTADVVSPSDELRDSPDRTRPGLRRTEIYCVATRPPTPRRETSSVVSMWSAGTIVEEIAVQQPGQQSWRKTIALST